MKFETEGLAGQIASKLHDVIANQRLSYSELPQAEQKAVIEAVERMATDLVDQAIDLVASQGSTILNGTMKNVTYKGDVCSTTVCFDLTEEGVHDLSRKSHRSVKLAYVPGGDEMRSLGKRIKSEPDQPAMFDDDDDGEPLFHEDGRVNDPDDLARIARKPEAEPEAKPERVKRKYTKKAAAKKPIKSPTAAKKVAAGIKPPLKRRSPVQARRGNDMDLASDG